MAHTPTRLYINRYLPLLIINDYSFDSATSKIELRLNIISRTLRYLLLREY